MGKSVSEIAIISEDEHTLAFLIESAAVEESFAGKWAWNKIENRLSSVMFTGCGAFDTAGFIEHKHDGLFGGTADMYLVNLDDIL
jgi:hypothetical protein